MAAPSVGPKQPIEKGMLAFIQAMVPSKKNPWTTSDLTRGIKADISQKMQSIHIKGDVGVIILNEPGNPANGMVAVQFVDKHGNQILLNPTEVTVFQNLLQKRFPNYTVDINGVYQTGASGDFILKGANGFALRPSR